MSLSDEDIDKMFENGVHIEDENQFRTILKEIDKKIRKYDEVIIDVSHGFRHLPILMTIDLIVTSLKSESKNKIRYILFAEEIEKNKSYKIVDLSEYLELANLAFIINIFKDNYSVSNHIKVKSPEYKEIVELMKTFSKELMGLSVDNLLDEKNGISVKLIEKLKDLENRDIILFKDEIKAIMEKLQKAYTKKEHRYQTFYYIAEDVASEKRGYLAVAVSLIFEGVSFYFYTNFKKSSKLKKFFEKLKNDGLNDYDVLNLCRGVIDKDKDYLKVSKKIVKYFNNDIKNEFYKKKEEILKPFSKGRYNSLLGLFYKLRNLRNNLLHANSGGKVKDVNKEVKGLLKRYKQLLIDNRHKKENMGNIRIRKF